MFVLRACNCVPGTCGTARGTACGLSAHSGTRAPPLAPWALGWGHTQAVAPAEAPHSDDLPCSPVIYPLAASGLHIQGSSGPSVMPSMHLMRVLRWEKFSLMGMGVRGGGRERARTRSRRQAVCESARIKTHDAARAPRDFSEPTHTQKSMFCLLL